MRRAFFFFFNKLKNQLWDFSSIGESNKRYPTVNRTNYNKLHSGIREQAVKNCGP